MGPLWGRYPAGGEALTQAEAEAHNPRPSNTGVIVTAFLWRFVSMNFVIDYLEFTFKVDDSFVDVICSDLFPGLSYVETYGGYGYRASRLYANGARIYYDGASDMGIHVSLPSSSLADLSVSLDYFGVPGCKCTRVDVCVDVDMPISLISLGELVSRLRTVTVIEKIKPSAGKTIYLGSSQSDVRVRIYDKSAESGLDAVLTRFEWQFRRKYASALFSHILAGRDIRAFLLRYLDFRSGDDVNVTRRQRVSWWASLFESLKPVPLLASTVQRTLEQVKAWLVRQVAPSLALLSRLPDFGTFFVGLVANGEARLTSRHLLLLQGY